MGVRQCKACGALIRFIRTPKGKVIPCNFSEVDYKLSKDGDTKVVTPNGQVIIAKIVKNFSEADGYGYISHWSTCTKPDVFRKEK